MILYRYLAEGIFYGFIAVVLCGGVLAIRARQLMNSVLGLALSLVGVAGLYFHLASPFLALMQIIICVGSICIIIAFGIMVGPKEKQSTERRRMPRKNVILAVSACAAGFMLLMASVLRTDWIPSATTSGDFSVKNLGDSLLHQFCLPFEQISVVLLAAIVGAIIVANIGKEEGR